MKALAPGEGSLYDALAIYLRKLSGADIRANSFEPSSIPAQLFIRFEVVDESGNVITAGRDLTEIRRELGVRAQANLSKIVDSPWYRDNITTWDFGDIPDRVEIQKFGMTMHAYPALVDQGRVAGLRLFESPEAARSRIVRG